MPTPAPNRNILTRNEAGTIFATPASVDAVATTASTALNAATTASSNAAAAVSAAAAAETTSGAQAKADAARVAAIAAGAPSVAGRGLSRFMAKVQTGQAVSVSWIGDSGFEGTTVTTPGTDDVASRVKAALDSRFGVVTTKNNHAVGGYTAAAAMNPGMVNPPKFSLALANKADLYCLSFGHNDLKSDSRIMGAAQMPGIGLPIAQFMSALEHMIRRIRTDVPEADILLSSEWQYTGTSAGSNVALLDYHAAMKKLAAAYGCAWVDYYGALAAAGVTGSNPSTDDLYVIPTGSTGAQHPSSLGHQVWAEAIMALMPADARPAPESPALLRPIYGSERYTHTAMKILPTQTAGPSRTYGTDGYSLAGTWSATTSLPSTSSTAGDSISVQVIGSEMFLRLSTGTGQGTVKIEVDGATLNASLNLSALTTGTGLRIPIVLDTPKPRPAAHRVQIIIVSGSVTFHGVEYLPSLGQRIPYTSGLITYSGATWGLSGANPSAYEGNAQQATTAGATVTVEWVGTALMLNGFRYANTTNQVTQSTDGSAAANISGAAMTGTANADGAYMIVEGLPYGRHKTTIVQVQGTRTFRVSNFFAYDEDRTNPDRAGRISTLGIVGDVITHPVALPGNPVVRVFTDDNSSTVPPSASASSSTGHTLVGTAAARVLSDSDSGRVAY